MNFSLWLWPYARWGGLEAMGDAAARAEELGFASVSVSDHTVSTTGAESSGTGPDWPDWSVLATYLATRTRRIRILSCLVVPYRPVLPTAKQIATIDQVSDGRFTLAAAVGWLRPEFEMLGVPFSERGTITDEYLRAMTALWTEKDPSFSGRYVSFSDIVFEPRCVQRPHVPIWIAGGFGPPTIRRVAELGDGWMPMGGDLDASVTDSIARLRAAVASRGRDPDEITIRYTVGIGRPERALEKLSKSISVSDPSTMVLDGSADEVLEAIARFERAGFSELAVNLAGETAAEVTDRLEWFGAEVMPALVTSPASAST